MDNETLKRGIELQSAIKRQLHVFEHLKEKAFEETDEIVRFFNASNLLSGMQKELLAVCHGAMLSHLDKSIKDSEDIFEKL